MESKPMQVFQLLEPLFRLENICFIIFLYFATSFAYQIIYHHFFNPLAKFPGPFWAGVTRFWLAYYDLRGQEQKKCEELCKKYGPIVRITPTQLFVDPTSALPTIYHRRAAKTGFYIRGAFGDTDNILTASDAATHAHMRKPLAASFSFANIKKMEPLIDGLVKSWIGAINAKCPEKATTLDFSWWARYLTFDVLTDIAYGRAFGFIATESDVNHVIGDFRAGMPYVGLFGRLHPLATWIMQTWVGRKFIVAKPTDRSGLGHIMRTRDRLLEKRIQETKEGNFSGRRDLLQAVLEAKREDGSPLPIENVKAETFFFLLAGADTVATALQGLLHCILTHEGVYDKVLTELDAAAANLSSPPQYNQVIQHCPYYIACLKESLRLYPPIPNLLPRLAPKEGLMIEGMHIPAGTEVTNSAWIANRDDAVYGPDVPSFKPQRWLQSKEQTAFFEKCSLTWGFGTRTCLGKEIALMELYKAPLQFLRVFQVEMARKGAYVVTGGLASWDDFEVRITPRAPRVIHQGENASDSFTSPNI